MNNAKYIRIILFCAIFVLLPWRGWAQTGLSQPGSTVDGVSGVGRGNPFGALLKQVNAKPQNVARPPVGEPPQLFAQIVALKYLDAESAAEAFACMSSGFGSIQLVEKGNALLIIDTKDSLEKIVTELRKADKSVPGLAIEAVTLKHLDAKSAKAGFEKMTSEYGGITLVEKSNSLIICDTKRNVEIILAEIVKIDSPIPGLVVQSVTLKYIDAKSAKAALDKMSSEYGSITIIEKSNSLIVCDTEQNVELILAEVEKIDRHTSGLFVETIALKFLDAKSFKSILDKMVSQYGSVATNDKTNSLIVCDTKENLAKILEEVKRADRTPQQIMVEVVILDVQLNDDTEIGVNWDLLTHDPMKYDVTYRQNFTTSRMLSTIDNATTRGDATIFNTRGLGGDFSVITGNVIRNVVHAIQQKRNVEILASPRVMMMTGESATIQAVEEIPYKEVMDTAQGGAMALTSTEFKPVGVTLQVTAIVTDGDNIFLTVSAEQNVQSGTSDGGVPIVDTRKANSSLLLKNGQIVVLGGLRRQGKTKEVDQIPFLGALPIVGILFKSVNIVTYNSELIVLISPHIYRGEPIPKEASDKYDEIKNKPMLTMPDGDK